MLYAVMQMIKVFIAQVGNTPDTPPTASSYSRRLFSGRSRSHRGSFARKVTVDMPPLVGENTGLLVEEEPAIFVPNDPFEIRRCLDIIVRNNGISYQWLTRVE